ncbi:uncharacterized protein LOC125056583 [Pieris napi]|uniref:uncharacterized protein LOC125056583 n=1 Tax=Pieris napi TaxID=78633 RepID=UPI001FB99260|nr:uncharacterized protein LOC125056583 [Pieris napi]
MKVVTCVLFAVAVSTEESFKYEQKQNYGLGRPVILNYRRMFKGYPYPEPLPSSTSYYIRSPYRNLYQGNRKKQDKRVYSKKFKYAPTPTGNHMSCEGVFECVISHLAIETNGNTPIVLRGGVGYRHFTVVIKAQPGDELIARVRAYCPPDLP